MPEPTTESYRSRVDDVLDVGLSGAALGVLNFLRAPGAWAERIVENGRAPRWHVGGRTFGERTFEQLWRAHLIADCWDRDGRTIIVATAARDR